MPQHNNALFGGGSALYGGQCGTFSAFCRGTTLGKMFFYVGDNELNKLLFVMQTERKQLHKYSRINVSLFVLRCTYIILIICSLFVSKKWLKYLYFNF